MTDATAPASTPTGSADQPVDPAAFALGVNGSFVARSIDTEAVHLSDVLRRAARHRGTAFMEVYQNCNVFNDGAFDSFREKDVKAERQLRVEHGRPLIFGTNRDKGLRLNPKTMNLEVVKIGENSITESDVLVHDERNSTLAFMLARMPYPEFPVALGVLFAEDRPTYDATIVEQERSAEQKLGKGDLKKLLNSGATWEI